MVIFHSYVSLSEGIHNDTPLPILNGLEMQWDFTNNMIGARNLAWGVFTGCSQTFDHHGRKWLIRLDKPWDGMKFQMDPNVAGLESFHHRPIYGEYNEYIHYIMNIYIIYNEYIHYI